MPNPPVPENPEPIEQVEIYMGNPVLPGLAFISATLTLITCIAFAELYEPTPKAPEAKPEVKCAGETK